jgi:heme oxygenase
MPRDARIQNAAPVHQQSLARALKHGTRKEHRAIERVTLVRSFLRGAIERGTYARLLFNLRRVYIQLEAGLTLHRGHPLLGCLYLPVLFRQRELERDLQALCAHGVPGPASHTAGTHGAASGSAATDRYCRCLAHLTEEDPALLIGHFYTRYLGDLSGGQILRRLLAPVLSLPPGEGLCFYDFAGYPDTAPLRDEVRHRLDSLAVDPAGPLGQRLVDEARHAFALNQALFEELDGSLVQAVLRRYVTPRTERALLVAPGS